MIEAHDLTRHYGAVLAVDRVSFVARPGEIVGLLGPNGAGKTTVMRMLTGYLAGHGGWARVAGVDVGREPERAQALLGYLPEEAPLYPELTPAEYLEFVAAAHGLRGAARRDHIGRAVERCSLGEVLDRPAGELSRGFRQRVGLAGAILHEPPVLILDEPTGGLDPIQIGEVRSLVRELGREKTVLFSTHILSEAEALCDRVLIISAGRVVAAGTPAEIRTARRSGAVVKVTVTGTVSQAALEALAPLGELLTHEVHVSGAAGEAGDSESAGEPGDAHEPEIGGEPESLLKVALAAGHSGEDVFQWAIDNGVRIRTLVPQENTLEEVFARLTGPVDHGNGG